MSSGQKAEQPEEYRVIYPTYSICPTCAFLEKKELKWTSAKVVARRGIIWFIICCQVHGEREVLYCADANFFMRCLKFSPGLLEPQAKKSVLEIEDLEKRLQFKQEGFRNTPLMIDISIYRFNQKLFLADDQIVESIKRAAAIIPPNKNFVLRVNGKLAPDVQKLNEKVQFILKNTNDNTVLLELSFDRIEALSKLPDSVLLNPLLYPSVHIYMQKGAEHKDAMDLYKSLEPLKGITNLQIVVTLGVSRPFPDMKPILELLRSHKGLIRFIVIDLERVPESIMQQFKPSDKHFCPEFNVDPVELLKAIELGTDGEISVQDFYPASLGMILEPFLSLLGMGDYNIRPSPFCGFGTCLVNSEKLKSVPVSRLFDVGKMFDMMVPVVRDIQSSGTKFSVATLLKSISLANSLKKVLETCMNRSIGIMDLWSYLVNADPNNEKSKWTREFVQQAQFIIVHNQMDVGVVDAVRRARCTICSQHHSRDRLTSACIGCI